MGTAGFGSSPISRACWGASTWLSANIEARFGVGVARGCSANDSMPRFGAIAVLDATESIPDIIALETTGIAMFGRAAFSPCSRDVECVSAALSAVAGLATVGVRVDSCLFSAGAIVPFVARKRIGDGWRFDTAGLGETYAVITLSRSTGDKRGARTSTSAIALIAYRCREPSLPDQPNNWSSPHFGRGSRR